jgi:hypothetical protein
MRDRQPCGWFADSYANRGNSVACGNDTIKAFDGALIKVVATRIAENDTDIYRKWRSVATEKHSEVRAGLRKALGLDDA